MILKRHFITLMEMLVVMALLVVAMGIVGIGGAKLVQQQRFRSEVDGLVDKLKLAQDLMIIFGGNVHVKITVPNGNVGFKYQLAFDTPLPASWSKEISRAHSLKNIHSIRFKDEANNDKTDDQTLDLKFLSNGYVMSKGVMQLSSSKHADSQGTLHRYISLPGYPAKIQSFSTLEEAEKHKQGEEAFKAQLTQVTFDEIREKEDLTSLQS